MKSTSPGSCPKPQQFAATRRWPLLLLLVTAEVMYGQSPTSASPADTDAPPVTVRLILVKQTDLCPAGYARSANKCPAIDRDDEESLAETHETSSAYRLIAGRSVPLRLTEQFQQALMADIDSGEYAVLLEFDWGSTITAVIDMVRASDGELPNWSSPKKTFHSMRHWYTHQNANAFDPALHVRWRVTLNGAVSFTFYIRAA